MKKGQHVTIPCPTCGRERKFSPGVLTDPQNFARIAAEIAHESCPPCALADLKIVCILISKKEGHA